MTDTNLELATDDDTSVPAKLYRRWWMAGPWASEGGRRQHEALATRAADGHTGNDPLLRALWATVPAAHEPGPMIASCRRKGHRGGPAPSARCKCGIHGTEALAGAMSHGNLQPWQTAGIIAVSGRAYQVTDGVWRVERAELVALVNISARWDPQRKATEYREFFRAGGGSSMDERLAPMRAGLSSPAYWAAIQADHLRVLAVVAAHYGVDIVAAAEEAPPK